MTKFLSVFLVCFCVYADVDTESVIQGFRSELLSVEPKTSDKLLEILEEYFNDGCEVIVNNNEFILQESDFPIYAKLGIKVFPKISNNSNIIIEDQQIDDITGEIYLKLRFEGKVNNLDDRKLRINCWLLNGKFSRIEANNVTLSKRQSLLLGIYCVSFESIIQSVGLTLKSHQIR